MAGGAPGRVRPLFGSRGELCAYSVKGKTEGEGGIERHFFQG